MTDFYKLTLPPRIREVVESTPFFEDLELQEQIVDSKMTRDYVKLVFVCSLLLIIAVML